MSEVVKSVIEERKGSKSPVVRFFAHVVSWIFHPVFMPTLLAYLLYVLAPSNFIGIDTKHFGKFILIIANITLLYPLLTSFLLKRLGFIQSIYMHDPKDRTIPLIATMIFYFWAYWVFRNTESPFILRTMLLGNFWGVIMVFLINIFYKISMHTSAIGGFAGIMIVLLIVNPVNMMMPFFLSLLIAGMVGTARMLLNTHKQFEIWMGYTLGIIVQIAAYLYLS
ncbi:MAG: hypothetical protein JST82_09995 [Bacteroidetes bacterium]|nr:hypothetical protein [Bacteroidota bacterium]